MSSLVWAQDNGSEPVAMPYQDENETGTGEGEETDFFDSLDFLGERPGDPAANPSELDASAIDGDINIEGIPGGTSGSDALRDENPGWDIAVMRGLDKVTARVWLFEAPVNQPVMFGRLEVDVRRCNKQPPEETPNTTAFVQVDEKKLDEEMVRVFSGWMFASSPGLNAVEHPVYDVWLIDCKMADPSADAGIKANVEASADSAMDPAASSVTTAD